MAAPAPPAAPGSHRGFAPLPVTRRPKRRLADVGDSASAMRRPRHTQGECRPARPGAGPVQARALAAASSAPGPGSGRAARQPAADRGDWPGRSARDTSDAGREEPQDPDGGKLAGPGSGAGACRRPGREEGAQVGHRGPANASTMPVRKPRKSPRSRHRLRPYWPPRAAPRQPVEVAGARFGPVIEGGCPPPPPPFPPPPPLPPPPPPQRASAPPPPAEEREVAVACRPAGPCARARRGEDGGVPVQPHTRALARRGRRPRAGSRGENHRVAARASAGRRCRAANRNAAAVGSAQQVVSMPSSAGNSCVTVSITSVLRISREPDPEGQAE